MTIQLTGKYGGPQPDSVSLAANLTDDAHLSYTDLKAIVQATGADEHRFRGADLVAAGFSQADAQRIMQALGEDFVANVAGSRVQSVDLTMRLQPGDGPAAVATAPPGNDTYAGLALSFSQYQDAIDERCVFAPVSEAVDGGDPICAPAPTAWGPVTVEQRRANLHALQEAGLAMLQRQPPADGMALWAALTDMAAARYAGSGLDKGMQADLVMQDLGIVLLGPTALARLEQYADGGEIGGVPHPGMPDSREDPMVQRFRDDFAALGLDTLDEQAWRRAGFMGSDLDVSAGTAFRPAISDKSHNQVFHTFFYQYLTYVTNDPKLTELGSLGHEIADGGSTEQDHNAGMVARTIGQFMRSIRDSGPEQWGLITSAAYGADGGPRLAADPDNGISKGIDSAVRQMLWTGTGAGDAIRWTMENQAIRMSNGLKVLNALIRG